VAVTARDDRFLLVRGTAAAVERWGAAARTVDDIRLLVAGPAPVQDRDALAALCGTAAAATDDLVPAAGPDWTVTLSARNPVWRDRPAWDPGPVITAGLRGAELAATSRSATDLRLQVDGDLGHLAVSLWDQPVGKHHGEPVPLRKGALRPTVAAALVRLALRDAAPGYLYDPFCGSGTIVAEAVRAGLPVFASDVDPAAVQLTRDRLDRLGLDELPERVFVRDVRTGPDPRVTARLLVANLPWGKQVQSDGRLALFDATALLVAHTIGAGGAAVLLTTHEEQLLPRLRRRGLTAEARRIGLLGQTPAIVLARP
jgi:predicted RNA methylase